MAAFAATPITAVSRFVVKTGRAGAPWLHAVLRHAVGIIFCVGFRCHSGTGLRPGLAVGSVELTDGFRLLGCDDLAYIVDRNPVKHGKYMPGTRVPIRPLQALAEDAPDYLLLLAWNFADEIMAQEAAYHQAGGRFIVPIPDFRII